MRSWGGITMSQRRLLCSPLTKNEVFICWNSLEFELEEIGSVCGFYFELDGSMTDKERDGER
jgi:hypothetical protein